MFWQRLQHSTVLAWGVLAASAALLVVSVLVLMRADAETDGGPAGAANDVGQQTVQVELQRDEVLRIAYLGDSLTAGLYASTEENTFRAKLTAAVAADGPFEEHGLRIVGGTVQQTLDENDEFPDDQHVYIVELGTNDINEVDHRVFNRQYEEMLQRVRQASPDAALVCLGTWRPISRGGNYDLVIRQQCEDFGGRYRRMNDLEADPINKGPAGEETFGGLSDDFHPNDAGHLAIFERAMSAIEVHRAG